MLEPGEDPQEVPGGGFEPFGRWPCCWILLRPARYSLRHLDLQAALLHMLLCDHCIAARHYGEGFTSDLHACATHFNLPAWQLLSSERKGMPDVRDWHLSAIVPSKPSPLISGISHSPCTHLGWGQGTRQLHGSWWCPFEWTHPCQTTWCMGTRSTRASCAPGLRGTASRCSLEPSLPPAQVGIILVCLTAGRL